jgi:ABC-type arginine/histidine transport system permease subunit
LETTTAASVVYLVLSGCVILIMGWVEKKIGIRGRVGRGAM